jgi:hypothetical protein
MKRIDDYVTTLSPEEREKFHDLIEECRRRELQLDEYSRSTKDSLEALSRHSVETAKKLKDLLDVSQQLSDQMNYLYLKLFKIDKMYHA